MPIYIIISILNIYAISNGFKKQKKSTTRLRSRSKSIVSIGNSGEMCEPSGRNKTSSTFKITFFRFSVCSVVCSISG